MSSQEIFESIRSYYPELNEAQVRQLIKSDEFVQYLIADDLKRLVAAIPVESAPQLHAYVQEYFERSVSEIQIAGWDTHEFYAARVLTGRETLLTKEVVYDQSI